MILHLWLRLCRERELSDGEVEKAGGFLHTIQPMVRDSEGLLFPVGSQMVLLNFEVQSLPFALDLPEKSLKAVSKTTCYLFRIIEHLRNFVKR